MEPDEQAEFREIRGALAVLLESLLESKKWAQQNLEERIAKLKEYKVFP